MDIITGAQGSVRLPRVLSATSIGTQGNFNTLPVTRYINDRANPLFIDRFVLIPPSGAAVVNDDAVQIVMHFRGSAITAQPVTVGAVFESVGDVDMPIFVWKLDKPLIMFQGDAFQIQSNSGANLVVSALGWYESKPTPQRFQYVPYVLSDRVWVDGGDFEYASEEALRNDGVRNFCVTSVMFRRATLDDSVRIEGPGTDWMRERIQSGVQYIPFRHNRLFETILHQSETLQAAIENGSQDRAAYDIVFRGYRVEPLPMRMSAGAGREEKGNSQLAAPGLRIRRSRT